MANARQRTVIVSLTWLSEKIATQPKIYGQAMVEFTLIFLLLLALTVPSWNQLIGWLRKKNGLKLIDKTPSVQLGPSPRKEKQRQARMRLNMDFWLKFRCYHEIHFGGRMMEVI